MHDFARVLHVKLRRYVLAPTEELKEKYKNYDLTTLGKGKKETVRDRSRSPLRCDFAIKVVPQSHSAWSFLHCLGDLGLGLEGFHWEWFSLAVFQWERFLLAVSCIFLGMIFTEFSLASLAVLLQLRWCRFLCIWFKCVGSYSQSCFVCRHTSWSLNTRNLMTLDWWFGVFLVCCLVCCLVCLLKIKSTVLDFIFLHLLPGCRRSQDESESEDHEAGDDAEQSPVREDAEAEENLEKKDTDNQVMGDGPDAETENEEKILFKSLPPPATDIATWQNEVPDVANLWRLVGLLGVFFQSEAMVSYIINSKEEGELLAESALNQAPAWLLAQVFYFCWVSPLEFGFSIFFPPWVSALEFGLPIMFFPFSVPHCSLVSLLSSHLETCRSARSFWRVTHLMKRLRRPWKRYTICRGQHWQSPKCAGLCNRIFWKPYERQEKMMAMQLHRIDFGLIGDWCSMSKAIMLLPRVAACHRCDLRLPSIYCPLGCVVAFNFNWFDCIYFPLIVQTNRLTVQLLVTGFFFLECFVSFVFLFWKGLFLLARLCFDDVDPVALHTATCQHFQKLPKTRWCQSSALSNFAAFVSYWFAVRNLAGKWQTGLGRLKVGFSGCHWSLAVTILIAMAIHPHRVAPAILHRAHHQQLVHLKGLNGKWFLF